MRKSYKLIIISLLLLTSNKYFSQLNSFNKDAQNVASPEIASLMKYTDFPENNYIGKTNISVPFYNINFGKLSIPLGLSYNTKGNKVADIATSVGLGWNLDAGGNLTVKVNDMNDFTETYLYYTTATFEPLLSLAWHRQTRGYLSVDNPVVDNLCLNNRIWENDDVFMDSAPDFYYLNAPGLNDKFYFTRLSNNQLKANFFNSKSKLNNVPNFINRTACTGLESDQFGYSGKGNVFYQIDKFEIIGENGYIYTFSDTEASIITEYPYDYFSHNTLQVNNWYLTKIKDPFSGREIIFEYEGYSNPYEHSSLTILGDVDFGNYPVANNIELGTRNYNHITYPFFHNRVTTSKLIPRRLKRITTDKEIIDLTYSFSRLDYPGNGLTRISVKNVKGDIIKNIDLNYDYFESTNCSSGNYECKRLKLASINDSSSGMYKFYYDNNSFPPRNSSKVDFLGYFNDNSSNMIFSKDNFHGTEGGYYPISKMYFYPFLEKNQILPFNLTNRPVYSITNGVDRTPNSNSKLGLLQKIVYPTGGSLELSYELDDFMYEGLKYNLGSTRVNKMKFLDSQNITNKEVNFKYTNQDNTSSGLINFISTPANSVRSEIASGIGFNTGAIIGYSRVVEETVGKGSIEKKYTNFNDFSDRFMKSDHNFTDPAINNFFKFMKFPNSYVQSFEERRGKLKEENYYKEGSTSPIRKVSYLYDYIVKDSLKVKKWFAIYDSSGYSPWHQNYTSSNSVIRYFNNVSSKSQEDFFSGNIVKEENLFSYDDARLTYKKNISNGDILEEYYRNAKDKSIQKLIDANVFDSNVEIEKKKNGKILSKQEIKYENTSNIFPSSELSYDISTNLMGTEINYDKYDTKGNLLQYTAKDNIPITVIWGYRQSQPIAKIEGATYSQIMQALGLNANDNNAYLDLEIVKKSDLHFDDTSEAQFILKLKEFRNKPELKDFNISTYTHAPLIGVKSITSPSGKKENYKYDTANRLQEINDLDGKKVKEYKYNYAPTIYYNNGKKLAFMTNNCAPGTLPASGEYAVPMGKYSSTISQADADQKAQDDVYANGQNYVNTNISCTPYTCTITPTYLANIYYSSFQETSTNHIKVILSFPLTNSSGGSTPSWSSGVFIGTLDVLCRPNSYKSISVNTTNGSWNVSIAPSGIITLMSTSSSNPSVSATLYFEYDK
ncbi:hypothetical protein DRF62_10590 [Chryseobacterium piscium]|uniref:DUF5977 domain-containing protein n=1 Tax=Chryseobacterium piscium TaxID=333702 RepID=A0A3D9BL64_9FLAO|nr:DUF5977 domain-containing protein [Chryseobacterium piscium]REC54152.1 hypothetical protein DRF62_10590 [Chryseobacterium piscium]